MVKSINKTYTSDLVYNDIVSTYGFDINRHFSSRLKFELLKKYTKKEYSLLDAGCANGLFSFVISEYCDTVHAIDINKGFLENASIEADKLRIKNTFFQFGDIENIPFNSNSFDLLYSYSVLVLVNDIEKAIKECARVIRKDGFAILDFTGKYNLSGYFWNKFYMTKGHFSFSALTWKKVKEICRINGLRIIETHALGFLDQWKYIPFVSQYSSKFSFLDKCLHWSDKVDLDYLTSNMGILKPLANRWYVVCQKI